MALPKSQNLKVFFASSPGANRRLKRENKYGKMDISSSEEADQQIKLIFL